MKRAPGEMLRHARYLMWSTRAVAAANRDWRARGGASVLLTRGALTSYLFRWAKEEGLIQPRIPLDRSPSTLVAKVFDTHRPQVIEAARECWRKALAEHMELSL